MVNVGNSSINLDVRNLEGVSDMGTGQNSWLRSLVIVYFTTSRSPMRE